MIIKIEKKVALPVIEQRQYISAFKAMKYGESFFIKTRKVNDARIAMCRALKLYKDKTGKSIYIITHVVKGGVRIWKVDKATKYPYN